MTNPVIRTTLIALSLIATSLLGVAAASAVGGGHEHRNPVFELERPKDLKFKHGASAIAAITKDPVDGQQWALRIGPSEAGGVCVETGRFENGRLGRSHQGPFEESPEDIGEGCGEPVESSPYYLMLGVEQTDGRLIIHGIADKDVRSISVRSPGGEVRQLPITGRRGFIGVFRGAEPGSFPVTVELDDGSRFTRDWDPEGGPPPTKPGFTG